MKTCSQCGHSCEDGTRFCPNCGSAVSDTAPASEAPAEELRLPEELSANLPDPKELFSAPEPEIPEEAPAAPVILPEPEPEPEPFRAAPPEPEPFRPQETPPAPPPYVPPAPPPAEPEKPEKKKKAQKPVSFGGGLLAVLLSILMFLFLLVPALIYDVRDSATEEKAENILKAVKITSIRASDIVIDGDPTLRFTDWMADSLYDSFGSMVNLDGDDIKGILQEPEIRSLLATAVETYVNSILSGEPGQAVSRKDLSKTLYGMRKTLSSEYDLSVTEDSCGSIAKWFEEGGFLALADSEALQEEYPAVYNAMHFGLTWYALGAFAVLALLCFLGIIKATHGFLRGLKALGVVLVIVGAVLTVAGLFAKLLPSVWEIVFMNNYLISALVGQVLFSHILIPALIALVAGVVLLVIVGLIRGAQRRRAKA